MICPKCDERSVKNGKTRTGLQKYKCKAQDCKLSFTEQGHKENPAYTKTEKRILSMLFNFLDAEPNKNLSLKQYLKDAREYDKHIKNPNFRVFKKRFNEPLMFADNSVQMLISVHNNEISLIKFCQPILDEEKLKIINDKVIIANINIENPKHQPEPKPQSKSKPKPKNTNKKRKKPKGFIEYKKREKTDNVSE